jgi:hypothetical protein
MSTAPVVRFPQDIAELRSWLHEQWMPGKPFYNKAAPRLSGRVKWDRDSYKALEYANWECDNLRRSHLYWVSAEMVDLLIATASSIPDDVVYGDLLLPASSGFVVFEKPWFGIDAETEGHQIAVHAMNWGGGLLPPLPLRGPKRTPCLSVTCYQYVDFSTTMAAATMDMVAAMGADQHMVDAEHVPIDVISDDPEIERQLRERLSMHTGLAMIREDHDCGVLVISPASMAKRQAMRIAGRTWLPLGRSDWPIGDKLCDPPWPMNETATASYVEDRKVLAAMWLLLHEKAVARTETHYVDRPVRRRAMKAGIEEAATMGVQVVTLRKLERTVSTSEPGASGRRLTVRHPVTGHFAWRRCGKGRTQRRLTFIHPYIKGPPDAPLVIKTRVNAWRR